MAKSDEDLLISASTSMLSPDELHRLNGILGRLHANLKEARDTMRLFGKCDPHDRWKRWFTENANVIEAMEKKLFQYLV